MKKYDLIGSIFWALVGAGFSAGGFVYGFGSWRTPGAGFLAVLFGFLLMALSIGLLLKTRKTESPSEANRFWLETGSWKAVVLTALALFLYAVIYKQAGFILASFLLILFLLKFISRKGWILSAGTALLYALVSYTVFSVLLETPLAKGRIYGSLVRLVTGL